MAEPLPQYRGKITFNKVELYANGAKKRFEGFVVMKDANGVESSYKMVSFRSQVTKQGEFFGDKGLTGKFATFHGNFSENEYKGKVTWQLMVDKMYVEGHEQLARDIEEASIKMPKAPGGQLPGSPMSTPTMPAMPTPTVPMMPAMPAMPTAPISPANIYSNPTVPNNIVPGVPETPEAYNYNYNVDTGLTEVTHVSGPSPIVGGYVYNG